MEFHDRSLGLSTFADAMRDIGHPLKHQQKTRTEKTDFFTDAPYDHRAAERRALERWLREAEQELEGAFVKAEQAKKELPEAEAAFKEWEANGHSAEALLDPDYSEKGRRLQRRLVQLRYDAEQLVGHIRLRVESRKAQLNRPEIDGLVREWNAATEADRRAFLGSIGLQAGVMLDVLPTDAIE